jgi:hypothetical protein
MLKRGRRKVGVRFSRYSKSLLQALRCEAGSTRGPAGNLSDGVVFILHRHLACL